MLTTFWSLSSLFVVYDLPTLPLEYRLCETETYLLWVVCHKTPACDHCLFEREEGESHHDMGPQESSVLS